MYLPLGSTLLRLLQLPLSLPKSDQPTLHSESVAPGDQFWDLGNLSPYHDAPPVSGVSQDLPDDCTVDQVILVSFQPDNY